MAAPGESGEAFMALEIYGTLTVIDEGRGGGAELAWKACALQPTVGALADDRGTNSGDAVGDSGRTSSGGSRCQTHKRTNTAKTVRSDVTLRERSWVYTSHTRGAGVS